jgi:hypothetical protein
MRTSQQGDSHGKSVVEEELEVVSEDLTCD